MYSLELLSTVTAMNSGGTVSLLGCASSITAKLCIDIGSATVKCMSKGLL